MILNLIRNGREARAETPLNERFVTVKASRNGDDGVRVDILDRGPGIDESVAGKLFTPYFTTESAGVGLGLSICRSIITSHGGTIGITPTAKSGAHFFFTLPGKETE